ncbi:MAG: hypothetical protein JEY71_17990 [Sphaerochaeta sp.]|nr:hypothetical protein [Sphaerochaeta sp.]
MRVFNIPVLEKYQEMEKAVAQQRLLSGGKGNRTAIETTKQAGISSDKDK